MNWMMYLGFILILCGLYTVSPGFGMIFSGIIVFLMGMPSDDDGSGDAPQEVTP